MSTDATFGWHAVQTRQGAEFRLVQALKDAGLEAYCPCEQRPVRHARRVERRSTPLFPNYIFVELCLEQASLVARADGVVLLLGGGARPVDPKVVPMLKAAEANGLFHRAPPPRAAFRVGDTVRIAAGPFRGFIAQVIAATASRRLRILTRMLGGGPMEIDADKLEPAPQAS